jgi:hypothetical protein
MLRGPGEGVMECAVIFFARGRVQGAPDVTPVSWWLDLQVVKPLEGGAPNSWLGLAVGDVHEV